MFRLARRFLGCDEDAADAVQDAFVSAWQALDTFQGSAKLSTWLHRIVVNASLARLRRRARRRTVPLDNLLPRFDDSGRHAEAVLPWADASPDRLTQEETQAQVRACIDRLPDAYRTVLILRDLEGLDTDATAAALGTSRAVVKTRLHRARQALRTLLTPVFA
jgi:RNA polymerase sigma-70 factor (ECF subfamily)